MWVTISIRGYLLIRRLFLYLFFASMLAMIVFYIVVHSKTITKHLIDRIFAVYGLSYKHVEGNALRGIEIEGIASNGKRIAKRIALRWNPNLLLFNKLSISRIDLDGLDLEVLESVLRQKQSGESGFAPLAFPLDIRIKKITLNTLPYHRKEITLGATSVKAQWIMISKEGEMEVKKIDTKVASLQHNHSNAKEVALTLEGLKFDNKNKITIQRGLLSTGKVSHQQLGFDQVKLRIASLTSKKSTVELNRFSLHTTGSTAHLSVTGRIADKRVILDKMKAKEIDMQVLMALRYSGTDKNESVFDNGKQMPVTAIEIRRAAVSTKPFVLAKIDFNAFDAELEDANYTMVQNRLQVKKVRLDTNASIATLSAEGKVKENRFESEVVLVPKDAIIPFYRLPFRKGSIKKIVGNMRIDEKAFHAILHTGAKQLFDIGDDNFNIDVDRFTTKLYYGYQSGLFRAISQAKAKNRYFASLTLKDTTEVKDAKVTYKGEVAIKEFGEFGGSAATLLDEGYIAYGGDDRGIEVNATTKHLQANFRSDDYEKGILRLHSKGALALKQFAPLPEALQEAKQEISVDLPLALSKPFPLKGHFITKGNLVDASGSFGYNNMVELEASLHYPKPQSLLEAYMPKQQFNRLFPATLTLRAQALQLVTRNRLKVVVDHFDPLVAKLLDEGAIVDLKRLSNENKIDFSVKITSLDALVKKWGAPFGLKSKEPIVGTAFIKGSIDPEGMVSLDLTSPAIELPKQRKTIKDIKLSLLYKENTVTIKEYRFTYDKKHFFATKPSLLRIKDQTVRIEQFWINDSIKVSGAYDLQSDQFDGIIVSDRFVYTQKGIETAVSLDLKAKKSGEKIIVTGDVVLLDGSVNLNLDASSFSSNEDIIILRRMQNNRVGDTLENLILRIFVKSKEPIRLYSKEAKLYIKPTLTLLKEYRKKLEVVGEAKVVGKSRYRYEDKEFLIKKGYVYLGGDIRKPMLDIEAVYYHPDYKVTIYIAGSPAKPTLNLSASPPLKREQILSLLLFGTPSTGDNHSANELLSMFGGVVAKAALADAGIKIDHLVIGSDGTIEVGKKLNERTLVIYIKDTIPKIKIIYKHSRRTQSVITASERSRSYDIVYKKDFKSLDDIVIIRSKKRGD